MVLDVELTLNRFGLGWVAANKFQFFVIRVAWWRIPHKTALSFEINWRHPKRDE